MVNYRMFNINMKGITYLKTVSVKLMTCKNIMNFKSI